MKSKEKHWLNYNGKIERSTYEEYITKNLKKFEITDIQHGFNYETPVYDYRVSNKIEYSCIKQGTNFARRTFCFIGEDTLYVPRLNKNRYMDIPASIQFTI